jgi:hypothetical protein
MDTLRSYLCCLICPLVLLTSLGCEGDKVEVKEVEDKVAEKLDWNSYIQALTISLHLARGSFFFYLMLGGLDWRLRNVDPCIQLRGADVGYTAQVTCTIEGILVYGTFNYKEIGEDTYQFDSTRIVIGEVGRQIIINSADFETSPSRISIKKLEYVYKIGGDLPASFVLTGLDITYRSTDVSNILNMKFSDGSFKQEWFNNVSATFSDFSIYLTSHVGGKGTVVLNGIIQMGGDCATGKFEFSQEKMNPFEIKQSEDRWCPYSGELDISEVSVTAKEDKVNLSSQTGATSKSVTCDDIHNPGCDLLLVP